MEGKKRILAFATALALLLCTAAALAVGGSVEDPLVTKSYVDSTYTKEAVKKAEEKVEEHLSKGYAAAEDQVKARHDLLLGKGEQAEWTYHEAFRDIRVKSGDTLQINSGSGFLLLAGEVDLSCPQGKILDLSNGWEKTKGTLVTGRRYLAVENTTAVLTVNSPTAVVSLEGYYSLTPSSQTDYNALAGALKELGMFKGSDTGFGAGYDLEVQPTRIQGLIMFLRLLGEEEAALASQAPCTFVDVPNWAKPYAAYAYEKGYTKGVDAEAAHFDPNTVITAREYMTFLLRALGYRETGDRPDFTWDAAVGRALDLGVLTAREHKMLVEDPFLRAQVVYLSYFGLDASCKDSGTLQSRLISNGALDRKTVETIRKGVAVSRLR